MRALNPAPSGAPLAIGAKLRATRLAQALTIADVAAASNLSTGFISRVERDETSPSVSSLVALCQVLSLQLGSLFEVPDNEVIALVDAALINMGGQGAIEKLLTPRGESRVQVLRSTLAPGASGGDELYTINCDVEVLHVLSGSLVLRLVGGDVELSAGDTMTVAGRQPHSWDNRSGGQTELLWTIVPAAWSGSS
ncbi:cupin domain-containing protein [Cryobacterium sp. TMT1-2-2]|uniref:cupin domain-containing protein n=1 Tax=Cryobacterium sp. TMT1-2-2 TaxID=1259233 RepID=UPI00106D613B|nr:cupin domain-containing protein [Cryobacterium sp. TMT1-2-2]MBC7592385.1 helix-turn-helix domain-containing protein [Aeromicrobium sp.]TFD10214.1 cupin domain-containing protein [Cryobacterium sp. TMT1-2-2]